MQDNSRRAGRRGTSPGALRLGLAVLLAAAVGGCGGGARTGIAPAKSEVRHTHDVDRPVRTSRLKIRLTAPGEPPTASNPAPPAGDGGRP